MQIPIQAQRPQMPLQLLSQQRRALAASGVARLLAAHEHDGAVRTRVDGEVGQRGVWAGEGSRDGGAPGGQGGGVCGSDVDDVGDELGDVAWVDVVDDGKGWEEEDGGGL